MAPASVSCLVPQLQQQPRSIQPWGDTHQSQSLSCLRMAMVTTMRAGRAVLPASLSKYVHSAVLGLQALTQRFSTCGLQPLVGSHIRYPTYISSIYTTIHHSSKTAVMKQQGNNFMVGVTTHEELYYKVTASGRWRTAALEGC